MFQQIKHKLLAGFLLIALLAALVGGFGSNGINSIGEQFSVATADIIPSLKALQDLRFAGLLIVSSTMEYVLVDAAGHSVGNELHAESREVEQLRAAATMINGAFERLRQIEGAHEHVKKDQLDDIKRSSDSLLAKSSRLISLVKNHEQLPIIFAEKKEFEKEEASFLRLLDGAIQHERSHLLAIQDRVHESISDALRIIRIGGVSAFIVAIVIGLVIATTISRSIRKLKEGAELLSAGSFSIRLHPGSNDELGDLSNSFNHMAESLEKASAEAAAASGYLEDIIGAMGEALFVTDSDYRIMKFNPAFVRLLGCDSSTLVGRQCQDFFTAQRIFSEILVAVERDGRISDQEVLFSCTGSAEIPVELTVSQLRSAGTLQGVVWIVHDIRERKKAEEEVRRLAFFDSLTGLPNRTLFQDRFCQSISMAGRDRSYVALLLFDLDEFKQVNETLGHQFGDELLQAVGLRLQETVRRSDTLARLGGDEFVVMMPAAPDSDSMAIVAQKLLNLISVPFTLGGKEIFISASIGISVYPHDGSDSETLLSHADLALYAAKGKGRNAFCFYSAQMNEEMQQRRETESRLRSALINGELFLDYQPQYDLATNRLVSVEALVRWRDPQRGLIPPDRFIQVAEESGLIHELGAWVLREACRQGQEWADAGLPPIRVAVNISGRQFKQDDLIDLIDQVLQETGLNPGRLELELTESILMDNTQGAISTLVDFKVRGIHLAIDDFGTGYSSLSYLKFIPLDRLKIDRSFVRDIVEDPDDASIVVAIIGLSHSLGLKVIAEGVETAEQMAFLKEKGCDEVQGYYMARPLPPSKVAELLQESSPPRQT